MNEFRSVAVFLGRRNDNILKNFRCINCGKIVFQYRGFEVTLVYDDEISEDEGPSVDPMCARCKVIYKIF